MSDSIEINKINKSRIDDVDFNTLTFGSVFTDHMLECDFIDGKWQKPVIKPYGPLSIDPSASVFHYGQAIFEGMKAYKDSDGKVWLFRPEDNWDRFSKSSKRLAIPEIPKDYFIKGIKEILKLDIDWVKKDEGSALYIRPFVIGNQHAIQAAPSNAYKFMIICSPSAPYYPGGVKVIVADKFSRAASGGVGYAKAAGNYAGQFYPTNLAKEKGFDQIIWTDSSEHKYYPGRSAANCAPSIRRASSVSSSDVSEHFHKTGRSCAPEVSSGPYFDLSYSNGGPQWNRPSHISVLSLCSINRKTSRLEMTP